MSNIFPQSLRSDLAKQGKFLVTRIDHTTVTDIIGWMMDNVSSGKRDFVLLISSPGGSPSQLLYFASLLRTLPVTTHLTGVALGECGSAALALLQCCHKRIAVKHTGFFIHRVQTNLELDWKKVDYTEIQGELEQSRMIEEQIVELQCARTGISKEQWNLMAEVGQKISGVKFFADGALALNIVDEVVETYPLF